MCCIINFICALVVPTAREGDQTISCPGWLKNPASFIRMKGKDHQPLYPTVGEHPLLVAGKHCCPPHSQARRVILTWKIAPPTDTKPTSSLLHPGVTSSQWLPTHPSLVRDPLLVPRSHLQSPFSGPICPSPFHAGAPPADTSPFAH